MKKINFKLFLFISFIIFTQNDFAQYNLYVSPGLKFGYAFGEDGGFVLGAELSVVAWPEDGLSFHIGTVISAEISKHFSVYHFGGEFGGAIGGIDVGPSIVNVEGESNLGVGGTLYTGFVLMPFFNYTKVSGGYHISQVGSYLKFPVLAKGKKFKFN